MTTELKVERVPSGISFSRCQMKTGLQFLWKWSMYANTVNWLHDTCEERYMRYGLPITRKPIVSFLRVKGVLIKYYSL